MPAETDDLTRKKLEAEISKLNAEQADISKPFFHKSSFWVALVPTGIAFVSMFIQYWSNWDHTNTLLEQIKEKTAEARRAKQEADTAKREAELATQAADLKIERAALVQVTTDWEISKSREKLAGIEAIAAEQNRRIQQLVEKQFDLLGMVCDSAGKIASAANWSDSESALQRLDDPEVVLIKNKKITSAISEVSKSLKVMKDAAGTRPEDLQGEVLSISSAARDAWEEERKGTAAGVNSAATSAMEQDFKKRHYEEAIDITKKLSSKDKKWEDLQEERRRFWQLYLGKLVLVESRGPEGVSSKMYGFGQALLEWKSGTLSEDARKKLENHAQALEIACTKDLKKQEK